MSNNSREKILDAAEQVVLEVGAGHVTLDAVAKKAGISKGGLIYNFPTKEALLQAMVKRFIQRVRSSLAREREKLPDSSSREMKAYITAIPNLNAKDMRISAALAAAGAHNPQLLDPVREAYTEILDAILADSRETRLKIVALATNGILFMELFNIFPFDGKERRQIIAGLLAMTEECTAS